MASSPSISEPRWINRLLIVSALLAGVAAGAFLVAGVQQRRGHDHGAIADVTVNLGGRPVREHCPTCHPSGGKAHSDQLHPDIAPHLPEKLGCTGCHLGEGMALDVTISHGLAGLGARTVLKGRDLQASCYRCHELKPLPGAERGWGGYRLFREKACDACHHVAGLGRGGRFGPDLSAVGSHLGLVQIADAISEPRRSPPNSIMPRFPLSRSQIAQLGYFLKSRVADPLYATPMQIEAGLVDLPALPTEPGAGLLGRARCLACHRFHEEDGRIAPDLSAIGDMRTADYLERFIANPDRLVPGAIMPRMPLNGDETAELLRYLIREARAPALRHHAGQGRGEPAALPAGARARQLYMELCQRCHAAAGDGFGPIQPNLAGFPRAFLGNRTFFRRIDDDRLVASLRDGIAGTSMPPYGRLLDVGSRQELVDLLYAAFIGGVRHDKELLVPLPQQVSVAFSAAGTDDLFRKYCVRCHGVAGTGSGPEHLSHLPRPRNLTNRPYFAVVSDERIARAIVDGVPGTAMPAFRQHLDGKETWALVAKVRALAGGER